MTSEAEEMALMTLAVCCLCFNTLERTDGLSSMFLISLGL